jgi:LruC domain-containing protein
MKKYSFILLPLSCALAWSCLRDNSADGPPADPRITGSFDYATTAICTLDLNYDLNGYSPDSKLAFELFAEDPYTSSERTALKEGLEPVFSAFADHKGKFSGRVLVPDYLETVWVASSALGAPRVLELPVNGGGIRFDATLPSAGSRAGGAGGKYAWPDDMKVLDTRSYTNMGTKGIRAWESYGDPIYKRPRVAVPAGLLNDISAVFAEGSRIPDTHPSLLDGGNRVIEVLADAEIDMVLLHESCEYRNTLGYYTYPKGQEPADAGRIDNKTIAFPNASLINAGGLLRSGDNVRLKYWNGSGFVDTFPAGTVIAFFVVPDGYSVATNSVVTDDRPTLLSDYNIGNHMQQMVAWRSTRHQANVLCVEDTDRRAGSDDDFNDVIFYVLSTPLNATTVPGEQDPEPEPDPDPIETSYTLSGTLIYEDLWPSKGDYDLNDVVIEYTSTVWQNEGNDVIRTEDIFRPTHSGASLQSGFAFQYNVPVAQVRKMELTGPVTGGKGTGYVEIPWETDQNGFEKNQPLATVLLFDDMRASMKPDAEYAVRTEFEPQDPASFGFPPYNPFLVILHGVVPRGTERERELHLPTRPASQIEYLPTPKANMKWFGEGDDRSAPAAGLYYVSDDNYPWAINLPVHGFKLAPEKGKIYDKYPGYASWASSNGAMNADWFLHPVP